jgi:SAM-dependent methyltransferase
MTALSVTSRRIGVDGLGTGTITVYGRPGDYFRIYEINPEVCHLASACFTYLTNCPGKVEIVRGDARLSMENETPQDFDLIALDAFSSDSIPVHLLTREAFLLYARHLKPRGIIAVHISNHYLDLAPVVAAEAREFNFDFASISFDDPEEDWWLYASTWVLVSHNRDIIRSPAICAATETVKTNVPNFRLWTDDFVSLFPILK